MVNVNATMELLEMVRTLLLLGDKAMAIRVLVEAEGVSLFDLGEIWRAVDSETNEFQPNLLERDVVLWRVFNEAFSKRVSRRWNEEFKTLRRLLTHLVYMENAGFDPESFDYSLYLSWQAGVCSIRGVSETNHAWIAFENGRIVRVLRPGWRGEPTVIYVVSDGDGVMACSRDFSSSRHQAQAEALDSGSRIFVFRYTVPEPLALILCAMGTRDQEFCDGYDAMHELSAGRYRSRLEATFNSSGDET
jgi:hypothetical protein